MRITRDTLLKIANETVEQRVRGNRDLLAAYLTGSLIGEDSPVLGGTTDIDLVFVHDADRPAPREIVRLTDEVHLDIAHRTRDDYRQPRSLRLQPWLGPEVYYCQILHDPRHFLDFTQAGVRSQFFRPDNVLARSRVLLEKARAIWFSFQSDSGQSETERIAEFINAVGLIGNALATLVGPPLPERRLTLEFPARAEALGRPQLYAGLVGLLGGTNFEEMDLQSWSRDWVAAYQQASYQAGAPVVFRPERFWYYQRAFEAILSSGQPPGVLWPLLNTWAGLVKSLPEESEAQARWCEVFSFLGFSRENFPVRARAMDAFLDQVEEVLDEWGRAKGI